MFFSKGKGVNLLFFVLIKRLLRKIYGIANNFFSQITTVLLPLPRQVLHDQSPSETPQDRKVARIGGRSGAM